MVYDIITRRVFSDMYGFSHLPPQTCAKFSRLQIHSYHLVYHFVLVLLLAGSVVPSSTCSLPSCHSCFNHVMHISLVPWGCSSCHSDILSITRPVHRPCLVAPRTLATSRPSSSGFAFSVSGSLSSSILATKVLYDSMISPAAETEMYGYQRFNNECQRLPSIVSPMTS